MSLIADFATNPLYRAPLHELTCRTVECMGGKRMKFRRRLALICCNNPKARWEEIRESIPGLFWEVFLSDATLVTRAEHMLLEAHMYLKYDLIDPEDLWFRILRLAREKFYFFVMEKSREMDPAKRAYRSIRRCLALSELVMLSGSEEGTFFALPGTPPEAPAASPPEEDTFDDLPPPSGNMAMQDFFSQKVLVPLAVTFWREYIRIRCSDSPHFLPVGAFMRWLGKRYILMELSIKVDNKDEDSGDEREPWDMVMMEEPTFLLSEEALRRLAALCADRLTPAEVIVCARHFAEPPERLGEIAKAMGLSGASGVARYKENFFKRLRGLMAEYPDFLDTDEKGLHTARVFVDSVHEECVKRLDVATAEWHSRPQVPQTGKKTRRVMKKCSPAPIVQAGGLS